MSPTATGRGSPAATDAPLPVAVLTGFLGSGKTTVLRHLLKAPEMGETAVIINEFGEIGLDHMLVESADEDVVLMNSGCLCCTIKGDLVDTIRRLHSRRARGEIPAFERLVIETTGLADPAPILHTLMSDPLSVERFRLDAVIATVDAVAGAGCLDRHGESRRQAAVADRILITKSDLADDDDIANLERRLRTLNPGATMQRVAFGAVAPDRLFGAGLYDPRTKAPNVRRWLKAEAVADSASRPAEANDSQERPHAHDVNRHSDRIAAFCLTHDQPLDWDRFCSWIDMMISLYGRDILRIKGVLNVVGSPGPVAIHGVQHIFHPPVDLGQWPDSDRRSKLVLIVDGLDRQMIAETFKAFNRPAGS